jgi:protein SSXT
MFTSFYPFMAVQLLDENAQLIRALVEAQNMKGKSMDVIQFQQILHRNLVYLAGLADPKVDIHQILPAPGGSNLLQSQRAPPPNQNVSAAPQNMTPPPPQSSMATPPSTTPPNNRPPNVTATQPSQWGTTPTSTQYNMKGYAPGPWLSPGHAPGSYPSNLQSAQQRLPMDRRQLLRMHQERLIRAQQQARGMGGSGAPPGMYPQSGYMGTAPQGGPPMGPPPSTIYGQQQHQVMSPAPPNMDM